uniref:Uncharacterized protein n=1 Tax=Meleagris gallopavo TaxID=9103 RepID=A0A803XV97_MELGA
IGKGNFRSVISMSKILSGVRISTKRIVTNGNKKISTVLKKFHFQWIFGYSTLFPSILYF